MDDTRTVTRTLEVSFGSRGGGAARGVLRGARNRTERASKKIRETRAEEISRFATQAPSTRRGASGPRFGPPPCVSRVGARGRPGRPRSTRVRLLGNGAGQANRRGRDHHATRDARGDRAPRGTDKLVRSQAIAHRRNTRKIFSPRSASSRRRETGKHARAGCNRTNTSTRLPRYARVDARARLGRRAEPLESRVGSESYRGGGHSLGAGRESLHGLTRGGLLHVKLRAGHVDLGGESLLRSESGHRVLRL